MDNGLLDVAFGKEITDEEKELMNLESYEDVETAKNVLEEEILGEGKEEEKKEPKDEKEEKPEEKERKEEEEKEEKAESAKAEPGEDTSATPPEEKGHENLLETAIIDDDVLAFYPEDEREVLEKYKGKTIAEGLKALAHAQRLIGKKQIKEETPDETTPPPDLEIPDNEETRKFITEKSFEKLRQKYADKEMPETGFESEEFKLWVRDLMDTDPLAYSDFIREKEKVQKEVEEDVKQAVYIAKNHPQINRSRIQKEIEAITQQLKDWGIEDPKSINIDFELHKNEQGEEYNEILNQLLQDDEGNPDPAVIENFGEIPLLKENALRTKFFARYGKAIIDAIAEKQKNEAIKEQSALRKEVPRTMAGSGKTGVETLTVEDVAKLNNYDDIERARKALEAQFGI